jgi:hypothetical protein
VAIAECLRAMLHQSLAPVSSTARDERQEVQRQLDELCRRPKTTIPPIMQTALNSQVQSDHARAKKDVKLISRGSQVRIAEAVQSIKSLWGIASRTEEHHIQRDCHLRQGCQETLP